MVRLDPLGTSAIAIFGDAKLISALLVNHVALHAREMRAWLCGIKNREEVGGRFCKSLQFSNAVILNAVGRRNTQMSANERK